MLLLGVRVLPLGLRSVGVSKSLLLFLFSSHLATATSTYGSWQPNVKERFVAEIEKRKSKPSLENGFKVRI